MCTAWIRRRKTNVTFTNPEKNKDLDLVKTFFSFAENPIWEKSQIWRRVKETLTEKKIRGKSECTGHRDGAENLQKTTKK